MDTMIIGGKIAKARKEANLSQAQLAQQLFISPQAVGKWERGESLPDIITFNRMAEVLGVDLNYFSDNFASTTTDGKEEEETKDAEEARAFGPAVTWVTMEAPFTGLNKERTAEKTVEAGPKKPSWDMSEGNWVDADFSGLKNLKDKFSSSNMQRCRFIGSDLSGILLRSNHVSKCDFSGSNFSKSKMRHSHLSDNQFTGCSMQEADFYTSYLSGCNLAEADFTGAVFKSGGIEKCTVTNTKWLGTSFTDTYFGDMTIEGTIEDCLFDACSYKRVKFENATLKNTFFKNCNLKRTLFVDCKADRMTYEFLKLCKADMSGIEVMVVEGE